MAPQEEKESNSDRERESKRERRKHKERGGVKEGAREVEKEMGGWGRKQ